MSGGDVDKSTADSSGTPVGNPDGKVEMLDGEIPTESGNNNIADTDKVSCSFCAEYIYYSSNALEL